MINGTRILRYGFCAPLVLFIATLGQDKTNIAHDGKWWLSLKQPEQRGFLNGYGDCYFGEYRGPSNYWVRTPSDAQGAITAFYESNASESHVPINEVLSRLPFRAEPNALGRGKLWKTAHGFYDGLYWRQQFELGGRAAQTGFIEGYLTCHTQLAHNKGACFGKTPSEYVALVTKWYGFDEATGDVDERHEPKKIAMVLSSFKDPDANCSR